ncbi:hypothetical protein HDU81_004988 [Chytriomyces hyalinus]|nr:hypothetical protein HDU81_004988 [Chytriomyces hyalinus]
MGATMTRTIMTDLVETQGCKPDGSLKPLLCLDYGGSWPHGRTPPDSRAITLLHIFSDHLKSFLNDIDDLYGVHQTLYLWQFIDSDCRLEEHHFDDELGNKFVDVVMTSSVGDRYYKALIELKDANERYIDGNKALDAMSSDELLDTVNLVISESHFVVLVVACCVEPKKAAGLCGAIAIERGSNLQCVNNLKSFVKEGLVFLFNRLPRRVVQAKTFNSESLRMLVFGFSSFHARCFQFDEKACKLVLAVVGTDQSTCQSGSLTIAFEFFRGSEDSLNEQMNEALNKYKNEGSEAPHLAAFGWLNEDDGNYDVSVFELQ